MPILTGTAPGTNAPGRELTDEEFGVTPSGMLTDEQFGVAGPGLLTDEEFGVDWTSEIPRSALELAARNFQVQQAAAPGLAAMPRDISPGAREQYQKALQKLDEDAARSGRESLAGRFGQGLGWAGRKLRDVAAAKAFIDLGQPELALRQMGATDEQIKAALGKVEEPAAGQAPGTPIEQGMAALPTVPKVAAKATYALIQSGPQFGAMAAMQALGVPTPIAGAVAFGATPEGFDPKQAAVAAALPYVGKYSGEITSALARKLGVSTDQAISIYQAAGGASGAMAYLGTIQASEIAGLPEEQRREAVIDAVASNLAQAPLAFMGAGEHERPGKAEQLFRSGEPGGKGGPGGGQSLPPRGSQSGGPGGPGGAGAPAPAPPVAEATRPRLMGQEELDRLHVEQEREAAEAAKRVAAPEKPAGEQKPLATIGDALGSKLDELQRQIDQNAKALEAQRQELAKQGLTIPSAREITGTTEPSAPETITGGNQAGPAHEQKGSSAAVSGAPIPAEGGLGPPRSADGSGASGTETSPETPSGTSSETSRPAKPLRGTARAEAERPWDIIDELDGVGTIRLSSARQIQEDFRPVGAARKLFAADGDMGADEALDALHRNGKFLGVETEGNLLDAINGAAGARKDWRQRFYEQERELELQGRQTTAFQRDVGRGTGERQAVVADDLNVGDEFELRGAKFRVKELHFDDNAEVSAVTLDDGKKYGTQRVAAGTVIQADAGTLRAKELNADWPGGEASRPGVLRETLPTVGSKAQGELLPRERGVEPAARAAPTAGARPRKEAPTVSEAVDQEIRWMREELARLSADYRLQLRGRHGEPFGPIAGGRLANIRYLEGQLDILHSIANAKPELKAEWFKRFQEGDAPDAIERTLDRLIAASDPLRPLRTGQVGLALPRWLVQTTANGALRAVRAAYRGGRAIAAAVEEGLHWLREQHVRDYNEDEARAWLMQAARAPENRPSYQDAQDRRQAVTDRLAEIATQARRSGGLTPAERSERFALARESREIQRRLAQDPDYVADLLRRMEESGRELERARQAGNGLHVNEIGERLRGLMEQLEQVPETLRTRIYNDLVARGELMAANAPAPGTGRTLAGLTAWLRSRDLDSPRLSLAERFGLVRRLVEEWNRGRDAMGRAVDRLSAGWQAFRAQYQAPPRDTGFRSLVKDWLLMRKWTGLETHQWVQEIRGAVRSKLRRQALAIWLDAGGNEDVLRAQAAEVPAQYRRIWETALGLTADEKALGRRIEADFNEKLEDGMNLGLIERGRKDYGVPQVWRTAPVSDRAYDPTAPRGQYQAARQLGAKLDPRDPFFALKRESPSYFDGIMHKGVPRNLDVGDLVGLYNADFHDALADRTVIKDLREANAADGRPVVMISGAARVEPREQGQRAYFVDAKWRPRDAVTADGRPYRFIDHWALRGWQFASVTETGNPVMVRGDFLVHPDHYRFLANELGRSWFRDPDGGAPYFGWLLHSAAFLKASKFASATFHMATLAEHSMFHAFAGRPTGERLSLLWPSVRGVELNPTRDADLAGLMRNGMELGFGNQRELFEEGLASHGGLFAHVPGLGAAMGRMSDYLFKEYMPKLKAKTGAAILHANQERYRGELTPDQIYEVSARQANAAFGAQDWRLMGTNRTLIDLNRLLLTAPDFLLSRVKVIAQGLKPYNAEQRYFLLAQAALVYLGARVLNQLLDHEPHWEPGLWDSVVFQGRTYKARFLVSDVANMFQDPGTFAAGRLGPFVRSGIEATTGRDMRTGARIEVPIDTRALRTAEIIGKDLAQWLVPVGAEGLLPGAAGREQTGLGQVGLALLGVGSRKYSAETQMWEAAGKFNRASGDAGVRLRQKERDSEAARASAYRRLDAFLEAGDTARADREFSELVAEGHAPKNIVGHYKGVTRPFTGARTTEAQFREGLTPAQQRVYERATQDRLTRLERLAELPSVKSLSKPAVAQ